MRPNSTCSCPSETGKAASAARTWESRLGSAFLTSITQSNNVSAEKFSFPECAGVHITRSRDPREPAAPSHHLHQGRCSRNHPMCKQEELEVHATDSTRGPRTLTPNNLHKLPCKRKAIPPCPSLQGKEQTQQLLKDEKKKADLTCTASGKLHYKHGRT